jgi:hypothetical protein
MNIVR